MATKTFLKLEMNYQRPDQRPSCANCKLAEVGTYSSGTKWERQSLRCAVGDFQTTPQAICKTHQPKVH